MEIKVINQEEVQEYFYGMNKNNINLLLYITKYKFKLLKKN